MNLASLTSYANAPIIFMASILIWCMLFALLVFWVIDGRTKKEIVIHTIISILLAYLVAEVIKSLLPTPRPFHVNGINPLTLTDLHYNGAFPSAHASVAFAISTTVWFHDKKAGLAFFVAAFCVGIGRVLSNVHYPLDIVGGIVNGTLVAYAINKIHWFSLLPNENTND